MTSGTLTGFGTIAATLSGAAAGIVKASGGTLDLKGTVNSGPTLAIDTTAGSTLLIDGTATSAAPIAISTANQTLEIGSAGNLTINGGAESITNGTIKLDGGSLTDSTGLSIGSGGTLTGRGIVVGAISGGGTIKATGGLLNIGGNLTSGMVLQADSGASSVLELGGTVSTSTSFTYLNTGGIFSGTLRLDAGALASFGTNGVITGMHVATGAGVTPTDLLDLRSVALAAVGSTDILNGNTIEVWNVGHSNTLASFQLAASVAAGTHADWQTDGAGGTSLFLDDDPCYAAGTRILTATGERMVESLLQGDIALTLSDGELIAQPVKWIGRRRIDLTAHPRPQTVAPVRIRRGAFADNMPHTDLVVSPDHAIFVDGKLICARQLINGTTIQQEKGWTSVEYFHVELDSHAILLAEGLPAESYLNTGNHGFFINSGEPLVLHPDLTDETDYPTREAGSCAPFVSDEASVRPVWQYLATRAAALGRPAAELDTTTDPELCIVVKGRTMRPVSGESGRYIFILPKDATEMRLISRAGSPTDVRPWLDDRRSLGVYVERIVLRSANELQEVPVDHPGLSRGWWAVEHEGTALRRWTDGDAMLPLPALDGMTMLEIRASNGGMTYLVSATKAAALPVLRDVLVGLASQWRLRDTLGIAAMGSSVACPATISIVAWSTG